MEIPRCLYNRLRDVIKNCLLHLFNYILYLFKNKYSVIHCTQEESLFITLSKERLDKGVYS